MKNVDGETQAYLTVSRVFVPSMILLLCQHKKFLVFHLHIKPWTNIYSYSFILPMATLSCKPDHMANYNAAFLSYVTT